MAPMIVWWRGRGLLAALPALFFCSAPFLNELRSPSGDSGLVTFLMGSLPVIAFGLSGTLLYVMDRRLDRREPGRDRAADSLLSIPILFYAWLYWAFAAFFLVGAVVYRVIGV